MKKGLVVSALVLTIVSLVVAGTLANYTTTIDQLAEGSVVAKEFVLLEDGTDTFEQNVKIAPTEIETWQFSVKNYDGTRVTETAMSLEYTIDVTAADAKSAIDPLTVTIYNQDDEVVGQLTGTGEITFSSAFALNEAGQSETYTVQVEWPSNDEIDINYAGAGFGTKVAVAVRGTQI